MDGFMTCLWGGPCASGSTGAGSIGSKVETPCETARLRAAHPCALSRSTAHPVHKKTPSVNPAGFKKGLGLGELTDTTVRNRVYEPDCTEQSLLRPVSIEMVQIFQRDIRILKVYRPRFNARYPNPDRNLRLQPAEHPTQLRTTCA